MGLRETELLEDEDKAYEKGTKKDRDIYVEDGVKAYLRNIGRTPLLKKEDEVALAQILEGEKRVAHLSYGAKISGKEEARNIFIKSNLRLVVSIANKYANHGIPLLDLVDEGSIGLMKAVDKFDYKRGFKFSTHASNWIKQSITRYIANQGAEIRIPVHAYELTKKVDAFKSRFFKNCGRAPTVEEIAEETGLDYEKVEKLEKMARVTSSLDSDLSPEDGGTLGDLVEDKRVVGADEIADYNFRIEKVGRFLKDILDEREEIIIRMRFGFEGKSYSLEAVGEVIGVTRERTRQIQNNALLKLRRARNSILLEEYD
ncbi:MAG: RNA polymerase sigma factor RpoD/SigA [archaeon]